MLADRHTLIMLVAGAASSLALACTPPPETTRNGLGSFTAYVDSERGLFLVRPGHHDQVAMERYALTTIDVDQNGVPNTGAPNSVELVTVSTASGSIGCGRQNAFCGSVTMRSFFDDEIRGAHVEITSMTPATGNEAFGDNFDAYGHSSLLGLWSYGNIGAQGSATRSWKFNDTSGTSYTFHGTVVGQVETAGSAMETNCTDAMDDDSDGDMDCADPDCGHDSACTAGEVCGNGVDDDGDSNIDCADDDCVGGSACSVGYITYTNADDGQIYRIAALAGATPVNLTSALDALDASISPPARDDSPAVSKNGSYITLTTSRFAAECDGFSCLAVVAGDFSSGETIFPGGDVVHPQGRAAISNSGDLVVFADDIDGDWRLFATTKSGSTWSAPLLISGDSSHPFNQAPVLSSDASTVLFNCGASQSNSNGTGVCQVGTDGTGFVDLIAPTTNGGTSSSIAKHADYEADGSIVFEADWDGEQIYRRPAGGGAPVIVTTNTPPDSNDNSPCSLPGGGVASLWLGSPTSVSDHELKIMAGDGSGTTVLTPSVDVLDIAISCHE